MYYLQPPEALAGSTLLQVLDKFALNNHNVSYEVTSDNIGKICLCMSLHACGLLVIWVVYWFSMVDSCCQSKQTITRLTEININSTTLNSVTHTVYLSLQLLLLADGLRAGQPASVSDN